MNRLGSVGIRNGTSTTLDYLAFLQFLLIRSSVEAINLPLRDWADFGKLHDSAISNLKSLPHQRYT